MDVSFAGKIIELNVGGFPATELMTQEGLQMAGIIVIRFFTKTILVLCQYVLGDSMFFLNMFQLAIIFPCRTWDRLDKM